jgi:hypothetical protein
MVAVDDGISLGENHQLSVPVPGQVGRIACASAASPHDAAAAFCAVGTDQIRLEYRYGIPAFTDAIPSAQGFSTGFDIRLRFRDDSEHPEFPSCQIRGFSLRKPCASAAQRIPAHEVVVTGELFASAVALTGKHPYPVPSGVRNGFLL